MILTFGKHKGQDIDDLSSNYIKWLSGHLSPDTYNNKAIIHACDELLRYRDKYNCHIGDD